MNHRSEITWKNRNYKARARALQVPRVNLSACAALGVLGALIVMVGYIAATI